MHNAINAPLSEGNQATAGKYFSSLGAAEWNMSRMIVDARMALFKSIRDAFDALDIDKDKTGKMSWAEFEASAERAP